MIKSVNPNLKSPIDSLSSGSHKVTDVEMSGVEWLSDDRKRILGDQEASELLFDWHSGSDELSPVGECVVARHVVERSHSHSPHRSVAVERLSLSDCRRLVPAFWRRHTDDVVFGHFQNCAQDAATDSISINLNLKSIFNWFVSKKIEKKIKR